MNTPEQEILRQAIGAFELATNAKIRIDMMLDYEPPIQPPLTRIDAILTIEMADKENNFRAEVNTTLTPAVLGFLRNRLRQQRETMILITRHVPPQYAKILREMDIQYIDTAGNTYINKPPLFIQIQGNRPKDLGWAEFDEKGVVRQAGLRVIFALLCKNELVNATYREIAREAGTALGTVDRVFKELNKRNFILIINKKGRKLNRKQELLDWWAEEYAEKLRPKLLLGKFDCDNYERLQTADIIRFDAQWGGEIAAEKLANCLNAEIITIYAGDNINDLILRLKLRTRPDGKIEIRKRFWNFEDKLRKKGIVHPILVYADLLATGDPRNIETAKIIYDAFIGMEI